MEKKRKVIFCIPTITKPYQECLDSLAASIPLIHEAGWEEGMANSIGSPYISHARATMLRKAQDAQADVIVFIDHDLSWEPKDLLTLIETPGEVVAGTYRFKHEPEEYMGKLLPDINGLPQVRSDGCVLAHCVPAGFLKITREGLSKFMFHYPHLQYIEEGTLTCDLFNHGVHKGVWYGEDYSFSRNWNDCGGQIWVIPNLNVDHHTKNIENGEVIVTKYKGNFHQYLLKQPGGSESDNPRDIA
jgi:glycosyltransferase involved in cell wall biosynthesis